MSATTTASRGTGQRVATATEPETAHVNEVRLVGRVSGEPQTTVLPSGDEIVTFRLVVERARRRAAHRAGGASVDTFDICCWGARPRQRGARLVAGDIVTVEGSLQRRFFRSAAGAASRYQVDADLVRRETKASAARASPRSGS